MRTQVGSSKVTNAKRRLEQETDFLNSIIVRATSEEVIDYILDDSGQVKIDQDLLNFLDEKDDSRIIFLDSKQNILPRSLLRQHLEVIEECRSIIEKFEVAPQYSW